MYEDRHACPGGCGRPISRERLSCPQDWHRLPQNLRGKINRTYANRGANPTAHMRAVRAALAWYVDNPRGAGRARVG